MVFGFGKGKMYLSLEKYNYMPGETMKGVITLKLKQPYIARKLAVMFVGTKQVKTTSFGGGRGRAAVSQKTKKETYYSFELQVDGEKSYHQQQYNFEIKVPADLLQTEREPKLEGAAAGIVKAAQILAGPTQKKERISWHVKAYLDIPKGFDVSSRVQVVIG